MEEENTLMVMYLKWLDNGRESYKHKR